MRLLSLLTKYGLSAVSVEQCHTALHNVGQIAWHWPELSIYGNILETIFLIVPVS